MRPLSGAAAVITREAGVQLEFAEPLFNPLMHTVAKNSLKILVESFRQKQSWENISRRKVDENLSPNWVGNTQ